MSINSDFNKPVTDATPSKESSEAPENDTALDLLETRMAERIADLKWHIGALQGWTETIKTLTIELHQDLVGAAARTRSLAVDDLRSDIHTLLKDGPINPTALSLVCDAQIAGYSADHLHPRGTAQDNTRHPAFVDTIKQIYNRPIRYLDLGCAGGGLVYDMARAGHEALGVEGSDYSLKFRRAEWGTIPDRLYTGDITRPIRAYEQNNDVAKFDVITAWEVLEHLPADRLPDLMDNLKALLAPDGVFIGSVATFPDIHPVSGVELHVTQEPFEWWAEKFERAGLSIVDNPLPHHANARGSGNPRASDWDAQTHPELGFHIAVKQSDSSEE